MLKNQYNTIPMLIVLVAVIIALSLLFNSLIAFFYANTIINSVILAVFIIGILYALRDTWYLQKEDEWLNALPTTTDTEPQSDTLRNKIISEPRLLSIITHFCSTNEHGQIRLKTLSPDTSKTILHSVDSRLNESRDILRYLVGLLIFLGLLGTFWGLLGTLSSISDVVSNLNPITDTTGNGDSIFSNLRESLSGPLAGMGTAFSSSLFGLGGSLVLGFLSLQAGQAQNRFYNNLENFLTAKTSPITPSGSASAYQESVMEAVGEQIAQLSASIAPLQKGKHSDDETNTLTKSLNDIRALTAAQTELLERLVKSQLQLEANMVESLPTTGQTRQQLEQLENITKQLDNLKTTTASNADNNSEKIVDAIRVLAKTIAHSKNKKE